MTSWIFLVGDLSDLKLFIPNFGLNHFRSSKKQFWFSLRKKVESPRNYDVIYKPPILVVAGIL